MFVSVPFDKKTTSDGGSGTAGPPGKSAYEIALQNGFVGTPQQWLVSIKGLPGEDGADGDDGTPGNSAYQIAVDNGFSGTETQWLASLKGAPGDSATADVYRLVSGNGQMLAADVGRTIVSDSASSIAITIPSGLNILNGHTVNLLQQGAGVASFVAGVGVTLLVPTAYVAACRFRYGLISVMYLGNENYAVLGAMGDA